MARKSLGHTKLIWICPNCQTRNPGPVKTCKTCGSSQPEDIEFVQGDREELITDKNEISHAKKGADIHCPYCGTRNETDAAICVQCGGKLTGGTKRQTGRVVGAHKSTTNAGITCAACGHVNKPNAPRCANCGSALGEAKIKTKAQSEKGSLAKLWGVIGFVIVVIIGFAIFKGCSRSQDIGIVESTSWVRSVEVEQFIPVIKEDWWENIPADAYVSVCEERYHYTSDEPIEGAVEVCGTPYTVDTGTGYGDVVEDCVYEVYDAYCEYEISSWEVVEVVQNEGKGLSASWPSIMAYSDQRAGEYEEQYSIWFHTDDGTVRFDTADYSIFASARSGSEWELTFDGFGKVRDARPK